MVRLGPSCFAFAPLYFPALLPPPFGMMAGHCASTGWLSMHALLRISRGILPWVCLALLPSFPVCEQHSRTNDSHEMTASHSILKFYPTRGDERLGEPPHPWGERRAITILARLGLLPPRRSGTCGAAFPGWCLIMTCVGRSLVTWRQFAMVCFANYHLYLALTIISVAPQAWHQTERQMNMCQCL